jgi:acetyl esterase/lipase
VLKYRVPRRDKDLPHKAPLQDAQRAIRLARRNAKQWDIDPDRIGILGFSAGGNLTVMAGTQWSEGTYDPVDEADRLACRPDFMVPVYAAYLGDKKDPWTLSPLVCVTEKTPPTFMAVTQDDKQRGAQAALLLVELTKAGVPAELHVYTKGGHGYGLRPSGDPVCTWPKRCEEWLRASGFLTAPAAEGL